MYRNLKTFVAFAGHSRSGHSIIGALLDAHPNIVIPHELDMVRRYNEKVWSTREELFNTLRTLSHKQSVGGVVGANRRPGGPYHVPNMWQGKHEDILVIGDKGGPEMAYRLGREPELFDKMVEIVNLPMKWIFVYRNPYDNITTVEKKHKNNPARPVHNLDEAIEDYFWYCEENIALLEQANANPNCDVIYIKQENFINHPRRVLHRLTNFLDLPLNRSYINTCASIVFKTPRQTRWDRPWSQEHIHKVASRASKYSWLANYTFEN